MKGIPALAQTALLVALAVILGQIDRMIPLQLLIPVPGIRLGLSNVVTLVALFRLPGAWVTGMVVVKCAIGALLGGGATAFLLSVSGGLLSLFFMAFLLGTRKTLRLSLFGVSMAGGVTHNVGQVLAATGVLGNTIPLVFLPYLLLTGLICGLLVGGVGAAVLPRVRSLSAN